MKVIIWDRCIVFPVGASGDQGLNKAKACQAGKKRREEKKGK